MRAGRGRLAFVSLVAAVAAGCGGVNAGSDYAAELEAFLDTQDAVASHDVSERNDLPYSGSATTRVTLRDDLDRAGIVRAVTAIVTHRFEEKVRSNGLTVSFPAPGSAEPGATTSFYVAMGRPMPKDVRTRHRLETLVDLATGYAAADEGVTKLDAGVSGLVIDTRTDPFDSARRVAAVLDAKDGTGPSVHIARGESEFVSFERGDDLAWLEPMAPIVAAARKAADVTRSHATFRNPRTGPQLDMTLARDAPAGLEQELERLAVAADVQLKVTRAV